MNNKIPFKISSPCEAINYFRFSGDKYLITQTHYEYLQQLIERKNNDLKISVNQYEKVVEQNRSLQAELKELTIGASLLMNVIYYLNLPNEEKTKEVQHVEE